MKQIAQNYKSGELTQVEVPVPACKPGGVVVRTHFSLVSAGTEMMKVRESKMSLIGKARARPDQVKKVMQSVAQQGLVATYEKVMNKLDSLTPLGYSLCGEIVEVGAGVDGLRVGQRVACGGDKYAHHAEYNWVPVNLCVPVPEEVTSESAAFATVGAIAMQGVRQAEIALGESACVIGLGLIGQLLVQLLTAAGANVVGIDISSDRCALARTLGARAAETPNNKGALLATIDELTSGAGVDHVFLAAGGNTNEPVELAAELARDRARIVDIGKCKLDLPWKEYYGKELDVRFSRSYGPGRYDPSYEEGGQDYPIGYVRWTERRNMQCFVDLLRGGRIDMKPMINAVIPFAEAVDAYERVNRGDLKGLGILFSYDQKTTVQRRVRGYLKSPRPVVPAAPRSRVRLGVIGCGNYGSSMLLPHLANREDVELVEVATATAMSAANAQRKFGFRQMSTSYHGLLHDDEIDAVMILTRHSSHASMVAQALRSGKAVFVEKPLAVNDDQLAQVIEAVEETGNSRLMVGFNRRFAPLMLELKKMWGAVRGPLALRYNVNAGMLDATSWYGQTATEGSRFIGEGCHFIDTISWWLGRDPSEIMASNTSDDPDNLATSLYYADGSVAQLSYLTQGDSKYPKEIFEVFGQGRVARLMNFQSAELWQGGKCLKRKSWNLDKGQKNEMASFIEAVKRGDTMPIPLDSLVATTQATFAAMRSAVARRIEAVASPRVQPAMAAEPDFDLPAHDHEGLTETTS